MTRERRRFSPTLFTLAALALPLGALAQKSPLGVEFQVNTYTTATQRYPQAATSATGDFVVVWQSAGEDSNGYAVIARRFSSAGTPLTDNLQINTYTLGWQNRPFVAASASGDLVFAWQSGDQDGSITGIFAQQFSSAGVAMAAEFQVNSYTTGYQGRVAVAASASGDFVVAWESAQDGSSFGIFARHFSSAGSPLAGEFQVNTYSTGYQRFATVAAEADGDFVIAWSDNSQDGSSWGVFARRFSSAGVAVATEFQVNSYTTNHQLYPSVAADTDGDFVVVWQSFYQDGYQYGVFARRFSSGGAPLGAEFRVSAFTNGIEKQASVAADADGDFVVAWDSHGTVNGVFARRFSSAGAPLTTNFLVNSYTPNYNRHATVAAEADGDFVVAWQSYHDGSNFGIFGQRFAALASLDVDGDGFSQPLTDGLLVLRSIFGFTGPTLTTAAIGGGCTRCDAAAIEPYVAGLGLVLDIDGNGSLTALTDGLLALRYLFGFTGATLTTGAIGASCTRCDVTSIAAYLDGLVT